MVKLGLLFPLRLKSCERGATVIEYAMLVAGIALAVVGAIGVLGAETLAMWSNIATQVSAH